MGFLIGLVSNIIANILFWALLGAVFWAVSTTVVRRFSQFFGLRHSSSIAVYLSNLWTPEGSISGRTEGYSISLHELWAAQSVAKLFGAAPLRLPDLVRGLVDTLWLRRQIQCATEVCPLKMEDADLDRNLIIIGASKRNSIRAHYIRMRLPSAAFAGEDDDLVFLDKGTKIEISHGGNKSEVTLSDANLAIVEKCHDPARGTTLFFCLGTRADSSWAATEYLVRNWRNLASEFHGGDFVICLGFPYTESYLERYKGTSPPQPRSRRPVIGPRHNGRSNDTRPLLPAGSTAHDRGRLAGR